jgi:hypothetical protein
MLFVGVRTENGCKVVIRRRGLLDEALPLRLDVWNHSPTGFEWGYGGSGPAQLALAILCYATKDDGLAGKLHQQFKREVVSRFDQAAWQVHISIVRAWVADALQRWVQGKLEVEGEDVA